MRAKRSTYQRKSDLTTTLKGDPRPMESRAIARVVDRKAVAPKGYASSRATPITGLFGDNSRKPHRARRTADRRETAEGCGGGVPFPVVLKGDRPPPLALSLVSRPLLNPQPDPPTIAYALSHHLLQPLLIANCRVRISPNCEAIARRGTAERSETAEGRYARRRPGQRQPLQPTAQQPFTPMPSPEPW